MSEAKVSPDLTGGHRPHDIADVHTHRRKGTLAGGVSKGEDPTVGANKPVTSTVGGRHNAHDIGGRDSRSWQ